MTDERQTYRIRLAVAVQAESKEAAFDIARGACASVIRGHSAVRGVSVEEVLTRVEAMEGRIADAAVVDAKVTELVVEIGVEGDRFHVHERGPVCNEAGCVPATIEEISALVTPHGTQQT